MKTAISVPDAVFEQVEEAARRLGISRSEFYAVAAQRWVEELKRDDVTDQVNAALDLEGYVGDSEFLGQAARRAFERIDQE